LVVIDAVVVDEVHVLHKNGHKSVNGLLLITSTSEQASSELTKLQTSLLSLVIPYVAQGSSKVGDLVGLKVGFDVVGDVVGDVDGTAVDGDVVGTIVGDVDGDGVGDDVGDVDGDPVGDMVGEIVGVFVGMVISVTVLLSIIVWFPTATTKFPASKSSWMLATAFCSSTSVSYISATTPKDAPSFRRCLRFSSQPQSSPEPTTLELAMPVDSVKLPLKLA
jgi:hypothetical protein